jgi:hypothetical protein
LLSLRQTFIHEDYGVNLVRLAVVSLSQYQMKLLKSLSD